MMDSNHHLYRLLYLTSKGGIIIKRCAVSVRPSVCRVQAVAADISCTVPLYADGGEKVDKYREVRDIKIF